MTKEEIEELNNKYTEHHFAFIRQLQIEEEKLLNHVHGFIPDVTLPRTSVVLASKMRQMIDTFQNSGKPYAGTLTMVLVPPYLLKYSYMIIQEIDEYVNSLALAAKRRDNEGFARLYSEKTSREKTWQEQYDKMANFDFLNDIEDVVKTSEGLPASVGTNERAIEICKAELNSVGYVPKAPLFEDNNQQIGQTQLM